MAASGRGQSVVFETASHAALHPGRSARIIAGDRVVGWLGELHPAIARDLEMPAAILFEFEAVAVLARSVAAYAPISRFPSVRRDVAVVVNRSVTVSALLAAAREVAPTTLLEAFVFDIYTGPQVGSEEKSVAIGLILQDTSRTLTDEDADEVLHKVRATLKREFKARIRE
jgi:phenylalanyl-tRNA synthetase beta chain